MVGLSDDDDDDDDPDAEGEEEAEVKKKTKEEKLEKIPMEKMRGRVIIFDSEKSEFAKNLHLSKKGDYTQKK